MKTPSALLSLNRFRTMRRRGFLLASSLIALTILTVVIVQVAATDLFWNTNGVSATWTSANWGSTSSGPFTIAWTADKNTEFTANSTVTFATTSIGDVKVDDGVTVTVTAAGTLSTNNSVRTFDIGTGATLTWTGQAVSNNSTSGFIKNGAGTWNIGSEGVNNYTGGFTLNAGTVIVTGAKSFGTAAMTINGGTIQSSGSVIFAPTALTIGGDFTFAGTANDTWGATVNLGASTRTITNNTTSTATRTFSNTISGGAGAGLTFAGTGGSGGIVLSGTNNYTGNTTISAGKLSLTGTGSIANSPIITVAGGATFDVSGRTSTLTLGNSQTLSGTNITATPGTINAGATIGLTMGSTSPLTLAYAVNNPTLTVTGGALTLQSGNPVTVTTTSALPAGSYKLISKGGVGSVAGTAPTSVTVNGSGLASGTGAALQIISGELFLQVANITGKFRSKQSGNWNDFNTWQTDTGSGFVNAVSGQTPTSAADTIVVQNTHTVTVTASVDADQLTVDSGGTLSVNNGVTFTIANGTGTDLTDNGTVATAGNITNNGQAVINNTLQINQGGFPGGGTGTYSYDQTNGVLVFNNDSGAFSINNNNYWPTTNGPQNVTVQNTGGIQINVARTVGLLFQYAAGVNNAGNLTLNGTVKVNTGGFVSGSPTFGSSSLLRYNTGGTYGRNGEWLPGATSGAGYPANVQLSNNTTLDLPNSSTTQPFQMSGSLTIDSGSAMSLAGATPLTQPLNVLGNVANSGNITLSTSAGGDLNVGGNWANSGTFTNNNRTVTFNGNGNTQTLSGNTTFAYLTINHTGANNVTAAGSTLNVTALARIQSGTFVSATAYADVQIDVGATLSLSGNITVSGNWTNNGTFISNGFKVTFNGATNQSISGSASTAFAALDISNTGGVVTLSQDISDTALNITSGIFDQGASSSVASGAVTVSSGATFRNLGTGDLTLSGDVANAGTITFNANGITCGDADDILIRSSAPGTQRAWSGAGTYNLTDVDVKDQSAAPPITVRNGTDSGNNTGWVFISACAVAGQTYTWTPLVGDTNWQNPLNWNPTRTTPSPDDVIVFNGTVTPSPTVTNVPTQTIGALQLINNVSVMMSTSAANTLTISSGSSTAFSVPSGNSLTLQGTSALRISLTSGSLGSVGGTMLLEQGAHQLTATGGSTVTFDSNAIFTTASTYSSSTNPFGTGTGGSGSNNSIIFASGSSYFHNNGGSPFGTAGAGPVVIFQTGSTATWLTSNGFQANGRTYANLIIGNPSTATSVSDSGTGNFQFDNLTIESTGSQNSSLTYAGSGSSVVTIQGDISSTGTGVGTLSDVTLSGGASGGIVISKPGGGTISFTHTGNSRAMTFESNATVASGTTLSLGRILIEGLNTSSNYVLTINGGFSGDANGYVIGNLRKTLSNGGSAAFEVGTPNGYSPVSLSSVAGNGTFTARANQAPMPNLLDNTKALQRYWTLANGGITSAILTFNYLQIDVSGNEARYRIAKDTNGAPPLTFPEGITDNVDEINNVATTVNPVNTFSNWTLAEPNAVTFARMETFSASSFTNGNLVKWQTGYEVDNLGFNVYRMSSGKLVRLTPSIVAGSAMLAGRTPLTAGLSYTWWDAKGLADSEYYVEDIDLSGTRTMHGPITPEFGGNIKSPGGEQAMLLSEIGNIQSDTTRFVTGYPAAQRAATSEQQAAESPATITPEATPQTEAQPAPPVSKKRLAGKLLMLDKDVDIPSPEVTREANPGAATARARREQTVIAQDNEIIRQRAIAAGSAVKIAIRQPGWYRVTQTELVAAGLSPNADLSLLQLYTDGVEQAIQIGADGSVEFYGTGMDTITSDRRTYWLIVGTGGGKRINGQQSKGNSAIAVDVSSAQATEDAPSKLTSAELPADAYSYTVERKDRVFYFTALLNGETDNYFGSVIAKTPVKQDMVLNSVDTTSSAPATLRVSLQGITMQAHQVRVMINGFEVGTVDFANQEHPVKEFSVPRSSLVEGNNNITLASMNGDSDINLVDYLRLTYWRTYRAASDTLTFTSSQTKPFMVDGFTSSQVRVFDITDPDAVTQLGVKVMTKGSGYAVKIPGGGGTMRVLLAVADTQVQHPAEINANEASSLSSSDNRADFIILTHRSFRDAVKPLADLRQSQGLETRVVDVEDVYDEFSYGAKSREAIKRFLALAGNRWSLAPRYVLFVGDASFDPRNYQGFGGQDLVPTQLVDATFMETSSDDALADFDGDGIADLAVGRLPVQNVQQAQLVIGKIVNYTPGQTANAALLVADHLEGYDFEAASNQVRSLLPAGLSVTMVNRANNPTAQLRADIIGGINAGPLLVNYAGHGSSEVWTGAGILSSSDAGTLANGNRLPFFVSMTCMNGRFQDSNRVSMAEALLRADNGGAVAVWASSGLTEPDGQSQVDQQLMRLLFGNGQSLMLGDAVRGAKAATNDMDVRRTWILFGDPTMRIR